MVVFRLVCFSNSRSHRFIRTRFVGIIHRLLSKSIIAMSEASRGRRIIWIDCEMTGLDVSNKKIVEIACIVTEADLTVVGEGLDFIISQPEDVLDRMDGWCKTTFTANGLLQEIRSSKVSMKQAENEILKYVRKHTDPGICPLGGNSVVFDRIFLQKYMPILEKHLHYRTIDVSSIKELVKRWYPDIYVRKPKKENAHRALRDIYESIQELNWYKNNVFNPPK